MCIRDRVNGAEEASDIDADMAQKSLDEASALFADATSNKAKIEATQQIRKAKARLQALATINS